MPTPESLRRSDRDRLKSLFYSEFDASAASRLLGLSKAELERKAQYLGAGAHFEAFRVGGLVLKRSLPDSAPRDAMRLRDLGRALGLAKAVEGLMPPFETVPLGQGLALAMPYGDRPASEAGAHWLPLADRLPELAKALAGVGLQLDDVAQCRCRDGVPFLVDLSDLVRL